jgi:hypothetical protein
MNAKKGTIVYLMILFLLLSACASSNRKNIVEEKPCVENLAFKKVYFENIRTIDSLETRAQNESFHESLKFIAKYTHVSFESMLNYARSYPYGIYQEDKVIWLKWYEENKCNNIQFKN